MQSFYDNVSVKQVDVTSTTGSFGILPSHVPAVSVLKPGLVTVYEDDKTVKYFGMYCTLYSMLFMLNGLFTVFVIAELTLFLVVLHSLLCRWIVSLYV